MRTEQRSDRNNEDVIARRLAVALMVAVALLGVIAWLAQGESLVATLVQQGLAWCF